MTTTTSFKIDPEIKSQWVTALRSGDYTQCTGGMHRNDGYCCLAVLYVCMNGILPHSESEYDTWARNGYKYVDAVLSFDMNWKFQKMNDVDKLNFEQIADYIEINGHD